MGVCLASTSTVKATVKTLRLNGCRVEGTRETYKVYDGPTVVYSALQKGKNGPWIVRSVDSDRISWT